MNPSEHPPAPTPAQVLAAEPSVQPLRFVWQHVLLHAWRSRRSQLLTVVLGSLAIIVLMLVSPELRPTFFASETSPASVSEPVAASVKSAEAASPVTRFVSWVDQVQSLVGLLTLVIAIFVWFGELREDWAGKLPCLMSVYFFWDAKPVIVCRHVWLAGEGDLRAWGQQVAAQSAGARFLDFSPAIKALPASVVRLPDRSGCRFHAVRFSLTALPETLKNRPNICRYQNFIAENTAVRDEPVEAVELLPDVIAAGGATVT